MLSNSQLMKGEVTILILPQNSSYQGAKHQSFKMVKAWDQMRKIRLSLFPDMYFVIAAPNCCTLELEGRILQWGPLNTVRKTHQEAQKTLHVLHCSSPWLLSWYTLWTSDYADCMVDAWASLWETLIFELGKRLTGRVWLMRVSVRVHPHCGVICRSEKSWGFLQLSCSLQVG